MVNATLMSSNNTLESFIEALESTPVVYGTGVVFTEHVDLDRINALLHAHAGELTKHETDHIKRYLKGKNERPVMYAPSVKVKEYGRLFARTSTLQNVSGDLRAFIANGQLMDIDIKSCSMAILYHLGLYFGASNKYVTQCYNDKEAFFAQHKLVKEDINENIYKSTAHSNDVVKSIQSFVLQQLYLECKTAFPKFYNETEGASNRQGTFMSRVITSIECLSLIAAMNYCKTNKVEIQSPVFDGFLVTKDTVKEPEAFLKGLTKHVTKATGIAFKWAIKPLTSRFHVTDEEITQARDKKRKPMEIFTECIDSLIVEHKWLLDMEKKCMMVPSQLSPYHYEEGPSFEDVVGIAANKHTDLYRSAPASFKRNSISYMETKTDEHPIYERNRNWFGFRNGFLCTMHENGRAALFSLDETEALPENLVVWNHFDVDFNAEQPETPIVDNIIKHQFPTINDFTEEDQQKIVHDVKMMLFGRTLLPLGTDKWHVMPLMIGLSGVGKSVLLDIVEYIHVNVQSLTKDVVQSRFFAGYLADVTHALIKDADKDFFTCMKMEQWRLLLEGGKLTTEKKSKDFKTDKVAAHMIGATNVEPIFKSKDMEVVRRLMCIPFEQDVMKVDTTLFDRIKETEIANLIVQSCFFYQQALIDVRQHDRLSDYLHEIFMARTMDLAISNDTWAMLFEERMPKSLVFDADSHITWAEMVGVFSSYHDKLPSKDVWNITLMKNVYGLVQKSLAICRFCKQHHRKGCCEQRTRTGRNSLTVIHGLKLVHQNHE